MPGRISSWKGDVLASRRTLKIQGRTVDYFIKRSARRKKTVGIRVARGTVEVAAPSRITIREVEQVLLKKGSWILGKLADSSELPTPLRLETGESLPYMGREIPLQVSSTAVDRPMVDLRDGSLVVRVAQGLPEEKVREGVLLSLVQWYGVEAGTYLRESVARWLPLMGRAEMPRVLVRDQRSRWGSCSSDGTLRFSWRLAMVEPDLIDSVVVHELAHLDVMNHSQEFWDVVLQAMPDAKERRKRLGEVGKHIPL